MTDLAKIPLRGEGPVPFVLMGVELEAEAGAK
jgi:hypothetical protein